MITGSGVPQLTAVIDGVKAAKDFDVPVISDGGIRASGDAIKALAAGASTVMIGSLFGGTDESPGKTIVRHGKNSRCIVAWHRFMRLLVESIEKRDHK